MALTFRVAQRIAASPEDVFAVLTDVEGATKWLPNVAQIERLDGGGPIAVGSRWRETRRIFGRAATEEFEVTELVVPSRLAVRVDGTRGASKRGEYLFTYHLAGDAVTDVTLDGEIRGIGGLMEMIGSLFLGTYRKACLKDLEALGRHVSERPTARSA